MKKFVFNSYMKVYVKFNPVSSERKKYGLTTYYESDTNKTNDLLRHSFDTLLLTSVRSYLYSVFIPYSK